MEGMSSYYGRNVKVLWRVCRDNMEGILSHYEGNVRYCRGKILRYYGGNVEVSWRVFRGIMEGM